ncbi:hypothetical protein DB30_02185 [Enhygromyxa salina]|uniref:Uncharacterized protein n=1 Tax=Enhygromyxa salina TaxID=215803 RepID=A0A0C2D8M1_9BACT|nr:hypothetical protein [Enhygromyxa salina]KIG17970.1 hypothetical protein DB30_02185 [Enhygromyxa salina]
MKSTTPAPAQGLELRAEAHSIHGALHTAEGGAVSFDAAVLSDHVVQVDLHTSTVSTSFRADYEQGELFIEGNHGELTPQDWRAVSEAYSAISALERDDIDPIAVLYTYRALGMMGESLPGFVWDSWDAKLPVLDASAPSFLDEGHAYAQVDAEPVAWADAEPDENSEMLQELRRFDSSDDTSTLGHDPSLLGFGPTDLVDEAAELPYFSSIPTISSCSSFLDDARDGNIECVEYGKYYCISFDVFMSKSVAIETISPSVPGWWSRAKAAQMTIPGPKALDGVYECNGRCGPGCDAPPAMIGGGGGWGVGCLIHDHCVYQSTGGKDVSSLWESAKHNIQLNPSCGDEMRAAADDHFMPPSLCPGSKTVGGSGKWYRYAPPRTSPLMWKKFDNKASSKQTTSVGSFDVEKPSKTTKSSKACKIDPTMPGCDDYMK